MSLQDKRYQALATMMSRELLTRWGGFASAVPA